MVLDKENEMIEIAGGILLAFLILWIILCLAKPIFMLCMYLLGLAILGIALLAVYVVGFLIYDNADVIFTLDTLYIVLIMTTYFTIIGIIGYREDEKKRKKKLSK